MQTDNDTYQQLDHLQAGDAVKSIEGYILCVTGISEEA